MKPIDIETRSRPIAPTRGHNAAASHDIAHSTGESVLGRVLVARTAVGVCAVLIGSDDEELKRDLAARFPGRALVSSEPRLHDELRRVVRHIDRPGERLDLSLDMRHGTPFQRRVWNAVRAIPRGATATYGALAERMGAPNAARAVAGACAANTIALGIPCHRVVRSDGALSGYSWGVERKRALIDKEALA